MITVIFCSFKASKVKLNLLSFNSVADHGELARKWCNDWLEDIPTTLAISGNDFLLIGGSAFAQSPLGG